jgi:hypothetical protein
MKLFSIVSSTIEFVAGLQDCEKEDSAIKGDFGPTSNFAYSSITFFAKDRMS